MFASLLLPSSFFQHPTSIFYTITILFYFIHSQDFVYLLTPAQFVKNFSTCLYLKYMIIKIGESIKTRFLIPFRLLPEKGLSPEKLAFAVTTGIISGLFPVIGATTLISLLLTFIFRQNLLIVQSVQWLLGLFQILLIIPFMQLGASILDQQTVHFSIVQIKLAFQPGILAGLKSIGIFHLYGILSWALLSIPAGAGLYFIFLNLFKRKIPGNLKA